MRLGDLVGPVHPIRAGAGLLHSGKDGERRAGAHTRDAQQFPAIGNFSADRAQEIHAFQMHILGHAKAETMSNVERGWASLGMSVIWILREALGHGPRGTRTADNLAGVVERLAPCIARLNAGTAVRNGAGERSL